MGRSPLLFAKVENSGQIGKVAGLARQIWNEHYVSIIGAAQVKYMLDSLQSADAITQQLKKGYNYYLMSHEDKEVGYLAFKKESDEKLLLSKIYFLDSVRGKGFGSRCLDFVIARAKELGVHEIELGVNKDNLGAQAAYTRWGFQRTRAEVSDIGGGFVMDDWIYSLPIQD